MIQLWIMNDQADAVLPELEALREEYVDRLAKLPDKNAAEETRLTRGLAVIGQLTGQIRKHQAALAKRPAKYWRAA